MFVVVDRGSHVVRVSGIGANAACWLGYRFAQHNPDLVGRDFRWYVVAFDAFVPEEYSRAETYEVDGNWSSIAYSIANIIRTPPPPPSPVHDCPRCDCKPGCCR